MTETTQNTIEDRNEQGQLDDAAAPAVEGAPSSESADSESSETGEGTRTSLAGPRKPMRFYIDFENVRGAGLKGVDALLAGDEVYVFFSQAAETFHIEQAIDILKSAAHVEFVEADAGTSNALDFQLITALFATFDEAFDHAIVSGDGGFDAAIKMGKRLGLSPVARFANILGDAPTNSGKTKSRTRRSRAKAKTAEEPAEPAPAAQVEEAKAEKAKAEKAKVEKAAEPEPPVQAEAEEPLAIVPSPGTQLGKPRKRSSRGSRGSGKSGKREKIAALLADAGIELDQQQLSTVMQALNGVKGKQQFYRSFVKLEGREQGGALYHQVKAHYDNLVDIVRQQ